MASILKKGRASHLKLGRKGEKIAGKLLRSKNYTLLATDLRTPAGELDIIALDGDVFVFTEVKTRRSNLFYRPSDNLSFRQFKRNVAAAKYFMRQKSISGDYRFDLIEVVYGKFFVDSVLHHVNIWKGRPSRW